MASRQFLAGILVGFLVAYAWGAALSHLHFLVDNERFKAQREVLRCVWKAGTPDGRIPDGSDRILTGVWLERCHHNIFPGDDRGSRP
jgi:hypothetical protein